MKHTRNPFVRGLALSQSDSTTLAIQKNLSAHGSSFGFASLLSISALVLLGSPNAQAANATWNGTTDATWATGTNWSTTPVPGNGNTATFNNAGGAIDTITTGAITINTILFDTASVAAYILGGATAGTGTITLNDTGAITMNSTVANDQLINANIVLGLNKTAQSYSITNNSNTSNLTLAGTISSTNNPMTGGIKTLNINGAGNVLLSGVISNGTATGVAINKSGAGTLTLSGVNTYATGVTTISGGTLSVSNLVNGGANSNIGATTNAAGNLVINGGTLRYTGATASTNRNFTLGTSGGTLDASGTGVLTITGAPTMSGTNTARTLTLTGDNTGTNTLQGIIGNNGTGLTSVTKSGTGTWVLSGANTYSGETRISEGTLVFSTGSLPTTSSIVMDGGTLRWTNTLDFSAKIALTAGKTANLDTAGNNIALATALGSAAPTSGLYKTGTGTLTLNGINNSYSGNTTINQGTFALGAVATLANSAIITVGDTVDSTAEFNVSSKAGGFDLAATQTLKGSGLVIGNVNVTGVLAPGNSIESLAVTGNLNLNDSSSLQLEIEDTTGTGADLLVVAGNLSLTGLVNLELSKIGGAEWEHEDKLTLVSYTGSWNGGLFTYNSTELADDSNFTFDNQEWRINYNDDTKGFNYAGDANGTFVTITAVPEPAAALLGGVGMLFLLRRRRVA